MLRQPDFFFCYVQGVRRCVRLQSNSLLASVATQFLWAKTTLGISRQHPFSATTWAPNYLQPPMESPPLQNSNATTKIKQQGLTLRWKFFILPPQQHKNRIINKIQVQLQPPKQPPFSQPPPQSPSLNIPLNIFYLLFAETRHSFDFCKVYFTIWKITKKCYCAAHCV